MTKCMRGLALILALLMVGALVLGSTAIYTGWYDVSATRPHTAIVHRIMDIALARSIAARADEIQVPDLDGDTRIQDGFALFRAHCVQCHGAPGLAPEGYAMGLNPAPAALVATVRERSAAEIFWIIREGIKMTGMPAWRYRLSDAQMWDVVAFMKVLPTLSPREYQQWNQAPMGSSRPSAAATTHAPPDSPRPAPSSHPPASGTEHGPAPAEPSSIGNITAGRLAMHQYLCTTCHAIPGVIGANHHVGPSLAGVARRPLIAGVTPNTPAAMQQWLMAPETVKPGTAMPNLSIAAQDARDIAAYLSTLTAPK